MATSVDPDEDQTNDVSVFGLTGGLIANPAGRRASRMQAELLLDLRQDGLVRLEKAEARTAQGKLWLSGIVPYVGRGLALSGGLLTPEQAATLNGNPPPVTFFVGGSWAAPFISPVASSATTAPAAPQE